MSRENKSYEITCDTETWTFKCIHFEPGSSVLPILQTDNVTITFKRSGLITNLELQITKDDKPTTDLFANTNSKFDVISSTTGHPKSVNRQAPLGAYLITCGEKKTEGGGPIGVMTGTIKVSTGR